MRRFQINSQKTAVSIFTEYDVVVLHPWLVSKRCCSLWKCPGCVFNCLQATIDNWFVMSLVFADFARWFHLFSHQFSVRKTFPLQERNSSRYSCTSDLFINNEFMRYGNRYIAIMDPPRYVALMTSRRATIMIALAWLIPLILDYIPALCNRMGKCSYRLR